MHALPLLFRHSLRTGAGFAKSTSPNHVSTTSFVVKLAPPRQRSRLGYVDASICLRCQFRAQTRFYSVQGDGGGSGKENKEGGSLEGGNPTSSTDAKRDQTSSPDSSSTLKSSDKSQAEESKDGPESRKEDGEAETGGSLPSHWESRRSHLSKQFSQLMDNLQSNIFIANRHLNDLTGYSAIEALKKNIVAQEEHVRQTRTRVREAKDAYSAAINRRSASQREVNELLQRKHAWTPTDLERFTSLYRSDHANERAETEAQDALMAAEREAEEAAGLLSKSILSRYHEEQIWSDKIRRMSTWGTWGLMGVNVLLFLIFQVAVEPWRRKRLVKGFEEKVMEAIEKENGAQKEYAELEGKPAVEVIPPAVQTQRLTEELASEDQGENIPTFTSAAPSDLSSQEMQPGLPIQPEIEPELEPEPEPIVEPPLTTILPPEASLSPDSWQQTFRDLFSERRVTLSQRDLTTVALESAAAGAAVMGVLIAIFRPR
ncbi:sensitivity to high expression protein she9 [Coccidioides posadasii str. Silveira]|uniref:Sensitive to high expression protein 9, mitochondrial n=3 Tax=Coccidioides posadasii TaxID=199306 RepID=E9DHL2_COCPS|nr:She9 / Mdm33 family protein [Coccidioides posadasii C735 delta SOWgp]EER24210.1 She9 / Mdm33 family protein [Coccidioides posadasii C735 delta SOWgp]EFW14237.1 conserved hypothetical protein [Coccidioides posadasii str. Silveira]KMM65829.1 She9/Mdm33 family protein [Coccidioides posadasii RMSCC 3488]QVM07714.1 sensitivity to high expression protein she9 [Coccidioides posadasii str. Silveira]|eukprot:XP_003066355.1 She9 / Mdm33 family protein [Coccidioides posadasii C735 delta SOWgp]